MDIEKKSIVRSEKQKKEKEEEEEKSCRISVCVCVIRCIVELPIWLSHSCETPLRSTEKREQKNAQAYIIQPQASEFIVFWLLNVIVNEQKKKRVIEKKES